MSNHHEGGCLCGKVRFAAKVSEPLRVWICYCRFCQRATGSSHLVEPSFEKPDIELLAGEPVIYQMPSGGSGKMIYIHFCDVCGAKLFLTFERFPRIGVFGGTFDDPDWYQRTPETTKYIFLEKAPRGTLVPPGFSCFEEHAITNDGEPTEPRVFSEPHVIG